MKKLSVFLVCLILSGAGLHGAEQQSLRDRPYSQLEIDILNAATLEKLQALGTQAEFSDAIDQLIQRGESPLILAITNGNLEAVRFFISCCSGMLKNEGVPTPFQVALKLSSMKENESTQLYPKSPHRKAILESFIGDPEVMVQPIIRSCWGKSDKGYERYKVAMEYFMNRIIVIQNRVDFSDYVAPQREWFRLGASGQGAFERDCARYRDLKSGRYLEKEKEARDVLRNLITRAPECLSQ